MSKKCYTNNYICPGVINLTGTQEELEKTVDYLRKEFEMKDLEKIRFCLDLQIEKSSSGMLVHQSNYTENVLRRFYMNKAHPLSTLMVVWSLDIRKDHYRPKEEDELEEKRLFKTL